jgi:hypothetical protein
MSATLFWYAGERYTAQIQVLSAENHPVSAQTSDPGLYQNTLIHDVTPSTYGTLAGQGGAYVQEFWLAASAGQYAAACDNRGRAAERWHVSGRCIRPLWFTYKPATARNLLKRRPALESPT